MSKYQEAKEKNLAMQRDYETALFHQMQLDKEFEQRQLEEAMRKSRISTVVDTDEGPLEAPHFDRAAKPQDGGVGMPAVPDRGSKPETLGLYSQDKVFTQKCV